jgi:hypothetical protein
MPTSRSDAIPCLSSQAQNPAGAVISGCVRARAVSAVAARCLSTFGPRGRNQQQPTTTTNTEQSRHRDYEIPTK